MMIENVMYFALGLLASGLLALMIMPAIWKRAVRLTKKRIEAATPITMAEFRADKDQLRAEFALSTRRLEMSVETLRNRLAEQLREINRKKSDLSVATGDRDNHLTIIREFEEREAELRRRVLELEKEGADLSQRLRMREREYADKSAQLEAAREQMREGEPTPVTFDGETLSGDYSLDTDHLIGIARIERERTAYLETQNQELVAQLEALEATAAAARAANDDLRSALAERDNREGNFAGELLAAEGRAAEAEAQLSSTLAETARMIEAGETRTATVISEKSGLEAELAVLRAKVDGVEATVMADWDTDRIEQTHLRERLNDIATDVARLVYAVEGRDPLEHDASLFERGQLFADDGVSSEALAIKPPSTKPSIRKVVRKTSGSVADRLAAVRDIQSRT